MNLRSDQSTALHLLNYSRKGDCLDFETMITSEDSPVFKKWSRLFIKVTWGGGCSDFDLSVADWMVLSLRPHTRISLAVWTVALCEIIQLATDQNLGPQTSLRLEGG